MFLLTGLRLQLSYFQKWKYSFYYKGPIPRFTKACLLLFLIRVQIHCSILWEKLPRETLLSGAVLTVIAAVSLIRWTCTISWLLSKKSEASFYFRKVKIMTKFVVKKKKKKNHCGLLSRLRLQLSSFHWGKILLSHQAPIPKFTKICFPAVSYLWKKLLRITVPCHEKYVRGDFSMIINYHIGCYSI